MKKNVIDTNALISFVTDRNPKQQRIMKGLFEEVSLLKGVILCHQHVLTEFVYVMDKVYHVPKDEIKAMVKDFILLPGIDIVQDLDFNTLFVYWPEVITDFGDAIVATLCKSHKGAVLVTFDQKLIRQTKTAGLTTYL